MKWERFPELAGKHAFLSASKSTWLRKSDEELADSYIGSWATTIGTLVHAYAADRMKYRRELSENNVDGVLFDLIRNGVPESAIDMGFIFPTLMRYVNDSIAYGMDPEVQLRYSDLCYGTTDAIQFRRKKLRIHDLKTGTTPAKIDQLMIYAALFFHQYGYKPEDTKTELRIYQAGDILVCDPDPAEIREVMELIAHDDEIVRALLM